MELEGEAVPVTLTHPFEPHKSMRVQGLRSEALLQPVVERGQRLHPARSVQDIRAHAAARLALLPPEYRRFENPHVYKVGLGESLHGLREHLRGVHKHREQDA